MRIYEIAKKFDISSNDVKEILDKLNITYKTHSSSIPEDKLNDLEQEINNKISNKDKKSNTEESKESIKTVPQKKESKTSSSKVFSKKQEDKSSVNKKKESNKVEIKENIPEETYNKKNLDKFEEKEDLDIYADIEEQFEIDAKFSQKKKIKPHEKPKIEEKSIIIEGPVEITNGATVKEFSEISGIPANDIIKKLFLLGMVASINQRLDKDTLEIIADELKIQLIIKEPIEQELLVIEETEELEEKKQDEIIEKLEVRPPVVTIMGHVNHGKTTLLDTIRKSKIVTMESGGITQHIGAYLVEHNNSKICFIDTPGHAAFTKMRTIGANVTDIVVLIVAANDGIQPQTKESIALAKEAEVPIIIAINKTDIEGISLDKIKGELSNLGLTPEDWGGDSLCVNISALKNEGINELLDAINLQAELLELKANPTSNAFGIVLESCQTDKQGPLVTVLIKNGSFQIGNSVLCGHVYGKIRRMENDLGKEINSAGPSTPVRIYGFTEVPEISARVKVYENDKEAREIAKSKAETRRHNILNVKESITIDNIYSTIQANSKKELKIILKTDVVGSIGALKSLFSSITSDKVELKIILASTGTVTDNDVMFANAYNALIFAFRVKTAPTALQLAKQHNILIREYNVIYHVYDDVHKAMEGMLDLEYTEKAIGTAEVKKTFKIGKTGVIAGCLVTEGKVTRDSICKINTKNISTKIKSLKHYKDEVKEVKMGLECGIALDSFNEFEEGDILEFFQIVQKATKL